MTDVNTYDDLPPTQSLVMEVLTARARLGEFCWTFSTRHQPALRGLERAGLVGWKSGVVERTCLAWLTEPGRAAALGYAYRTPAVRLLEEALHLRVNGEYAPGGRENWRDWERAAESLLRGLLPPERGEPAPSPKREAKPACRGFRWIGQSFASCDGCGKPAWEHDGMLGLREGMTALSVGAGDDVWEVIPWKPGEAEAIKQRWAP